MATKGATAWQASFARLAEHIGVALGDADALSPRTALYHPLPRAPMDWLLEQFPAYFQNARGVRVPLAPHHDEYWAWLWALRPGVPARPFIQVLARGGGKSTELELGSAVVGYFGLRRYTLYLCDTQSQADDHVATVATLLETLGVDRAINRYGFSLGWNINRLSTADGYVQDAIGMDKAVRGAKRGWQRPDLLFLDELDDQLDTRVTTAKKIDVLTRKILPTAAASRAVCGVQNIPNKDGVFAQLVDGRAEFLLDRQLSGPHPALRDLPLQDWYVQEVGDEGAPRLRLTGGTPVWAGQDRGDCEDLLNLIGPRAFLIECQHRIASLGGTIFQRHWFPVVREVPAGCTWVRYWDFAATAEPDGRRRGKDPDWTVGLLVGLWRGQFYVRDMQRHRLTPHGVEAMVTQTAALDGRHVTIWLEEEGGASGKALIADYRQRVLLGYTVRAWHATGSKGDRATPVAAAAEVGNVLLLQAPWNYPFLEEVADFGLDGVHDDIVDALSGAHYALTLGQTVLAREFSLAPGLREGGQPGLAVRAQHAAFQPALGRAWQGDDAADDVPLSAWSQAL